MQIERLRPAVLRVTLHAYELATLTAAARWAADGAEGELNPEIRDQLDDVLAGYDEALRTANAASDSARSGSSSGDGAGASGDGAGG